MRKSVRFGKQLVIPTGEGKIPGLDGRIIYVPSDHQALNYLLQSAEGITCKAALSYQMQKIKEEGLKAEPRLFYTMRQHGYPTLMMRKELVRSSRNRSLKGRSYLM